MTRAIQMPTPSAPPTVLAATTGRLLHGLHGLRARAPVLAMVAAALLAAGCASPPDRYYTLAAPAAAAGTEAPPVAGLFIDVAPIAMPERLARPQMVVSRDGAPAAEVALMEQHRWSASFESELRDALAAGVAARLGAVDVTRGARASDAPAWRIAVQLQRFDLIENRRAEASLAWTARRADARPGTACRWSGSEPAAGGIDGLALAAQRLTAQASERIARHVRALQADPSAPCPA